MTSTILIADDDPVQRRLLETMMRRFGYQTETVEGGEQALARLTQAGASPISLLILDLVMPDLDGMAVLARMRAQRIAVPVIVETAHGSIEAVIAAMRAGAYDFVVKPVGAERLQISIKNALSADALAGEIRKINRRSQGALTFKDLATRSEDMARVIRLGERAARSTIPVLIEGESGVGKELVARAIQGASDRKSKPFVTVNCGALPANLVESILFGHEKGAFTGATEKHTGKFVEANGGALFLDEISELPLETQVKLLRALQEGEIDPVGAKRPVRVDIRLISASNQNLIDLVKRGLFREDLFYRLNVFPIAIPPLRARKDDIGDLARRFAARFAAEEGKSVRGISAEALALLSSYDWPGNVRQLENAVFRAVVLADGDELTVAEFPQIAAHVEGFDVRVPPLPAPAVANNAPAREIVRVEIRDPNVLKLLGQHAEMRRLDDLEAETIRFALAHYRGQMSEIARRLGIGRSTLYRKMKEYGLGEAAEPASGESQQNVDAA
ncbi:MAG: sigma-54-dependent Fis family transcriptional regulator [Methylocystis sp.]|nr:sigma-54-dependent Fis family transcriptional regulator [Methylocystis sp.]